MCDRRHYQCSTFCGKVDVFILAFVPRVVVFHVIIFAAMLCMNYPRCRDCAFSASFVRECTDVSYFAGEGVELNVLRESVVVEEIKEVQLRSRRVHFIYDRNYNLIGLQPRGHTPNRLPVKKLRRLLHKRRKVRVFVWKGILKNIISYYSCAFTINPQPRRRSVRSQSVLFIINNIHFRVKTFKCRKRGLGFTEGCDLLNRARIDSNFR